MTAENTVEEERTVPVVVDIVLGNLFEEGGMIAGEPSHSGHTVLAERSHTELVVEEHREMHSTRKLLAFFS